MAHVKDFLPAVRALGFKKFIMLLIREISQDQLTTQAAAMAYAWLFAVFPFLLFMLTLFAYIPEQQKVDARKLVEDSVRKVMAHDAADTILVNLNEVLNQPHTGLLGFGIIATLWIASGGMSMTMTALDTAFDVKRTWPFYVQKPIAILLTILVVALILLVFLVLPIGTAIESWLAVNWHLPSRSVWVITCARYTIAFLLLHCVLVLLYTFGTRKRRRFVFLSPGALFTLVVWFALQAAFRFYIDRFGSYQKTYGAIGGVAILLLFFYLDGLVLLIGAEIDNLVDHSRGKSEGGMQNAERKPESPTSV